jgi:hypothetical protein
MQLFAAFEESEVLANGKEKSMAEIHEPGGDEMTRGVREPLHKVEKPCRGAQQRARSSRFQNETTTKAAGALLCAPTPPVETNLRKGFSGGHHLGGVRPPALLYSLMFVRL